MMADTYGERIRAARKRAGLKQAYIEWKFGFGHGYMTHYEHNHRKPKIETLKKFAEIFGCDVSDLIPDEEKVAVLSAMPSNPYWERICAIAKQQRAKGVKTYGQGIEANPEALHKRIDMALEELIDLAMYLCWVDDKIKELEDEA